MHSNSYTDNVRDSNLAGPAAREAGYWKAGWRLMQIAGLALTAFLFAAAASCLDGGGRLSGLVTDPSGGAMAGVAVQAIGAETGLQYNAVTSAEGFYVFPVLPAGHYELRIDQAGFKPYQRKNVDVTSNSAARADVVLVLGPRSEAITIEESPVAVDLSNTQTGERIGAAKMADIPVNGRSYTDLLALQPGVIPVTSQQPNAVVMSGCTSAPPSGDLNSGNISVSGQRETTNGFSVNGSSAQEDFNMGAAVVPNLESIQEFQVLTGNFDAQYGNFSGGQVLVTTKSGTNQLHGSGFEFLRNTNLDARNYFASDRARYDRNQFGSSLGGPDNKRRRPGTDPTRDTLLVLGRVVPFCGARFSAMPLSFQDLERFQVLMFSRPSMEQVPCHLNHWRFGLQRCLPLPGRRPASRGNPCILLITVDMLTEREN